MYMYHISIYFVSVDSCNLLLHVHVHRVTRVSIVLTLCMLGNFS